MLLCTKEEFPLCTSTIILIASSLPTLPSLSLYIPDTMSNNTFLMFNLLEEYMRSAVQSCSLQNVGFHE